MLEQHFSGWIKHNNIEKSQKVLCGVSGGIDSMVMLDLFKNLGFNIGVAHINYQLRGEDSNQDARLVQNYCAIHNIEFFKHLAIKNENQNMQEWARYIRFDFFAKIKKENNYDYVALAHHSEDQLETILLSIFKGYSIQRIDSIRNFILRPMLDFAKQSIIDYASANDIQFREDKSNLSNVYDRNFLRNVIIPKLSDRFPNFKNRINKFAERQKKEKSVLYDFILEKVKNFKKEQSNNIANYHYSNFDLGILSEQNGNYILEKFLNKEYGLLHTQVRDLLASKNPSSYIESDLFIAQKTHSHLFVGKKDQIQKNLNVISENELPFDHRILSLSREAYQSAHKKSSSLIVDFDKIEFPLHLRLAQNNEKFKAFGLKGKTTEIGKFLQKLKIPSKFRAKEYILIDHHHQIIIPGMEIDYGLKLDKYTKTALIIDLKDKSR